MHSISEKDTTAPAPIGRGTIESQRGHAMSARNYTATAPARIAGGTTSTPSLRALSATRLPTSRKMEGWKAIAYVMIVEERECECCGQVHTAPAISPRVKMVNRKGDTQTISMGLMHDIYTELAKAMHREFAYPLLPRSIEYVKVAVNACPFCFTSYTADQSDLWQTETPVKMTEIMQTLQESKIVEAMDSDDELKAFLDRKKNNAKARNLAANAIKVKPLNLAAALAGLRAS